MRKLLTQGRELLNQNLIQLMLVAILSLRRFIKKNTLGKCSTMLIILQSGQSMRRIKIKVVWDRSMTAMQKQELSTQMTFRSWPWSFLIRWSKHGMMLTNNVVEIDLENFSLIFYSLF